MLLRQFHIEDQHRALLIRNGRVAKILVPGNHLIFKSPFTAIETEVHDIRRLAFRSGWSGYLLRERPDMIERHFVVIETTQFQIAMIHVDSQLHKVLLPAKRMMLWRDAARITADIVDIIANPAMPDSMLSALERRQNVSVVCDEVLRPPALALKSRPELAENGEFRELASVGSGGGKSFQPTHYQRRTS